MTEISFTKTKSYHSPICVDIYATNNETEILIENLNFCQHGGDKFAFFINPPRKIKIKLINCIFPVDFYYKDTEKLISEIGCIYYDL